MIGVRLAAGVVGAGILGLRASFRITEIHAERERDLKAKGVPFVYTLWHGRMVLCILAHLHEDIVTMASRSKDGEVIARWLVRNGYIPVRGSTGKRGGAALQEMIDLVRAGHAAALTIDGPKGPAARGPARGPEARPRDGRLDPALHGREQPALVLEVLGPLPRAEALLAVRRRVRRALRDPRGHAGRRGAREDRRGRGRDHDEVDRLVGVVPPPPWARESVDRAD